MAEFTAGDVIVPVVPSARGFINDLKKQILPGAYKLGQEIGQDIQRGISDSLKGIYEPLKEQTQKQRTQAPKDGDEIAGAFARGFKARLQAAFQSLPKAQVDVDSTAAEVRLSELRAQMQALSSKTVGVDLDAGTALAEVAAIQRELQALDGDDVSVDVRVDIGAALAELAAVQTSIASVDGKTANARVDVDVSGALAAVATLGAALAALAVIPVGASIGAGLLALSGPLAAAGAGLGGLAAVAGPSLTRINDALKDQEKSATGAAGALNAAAGATRNLAIEQAQAQIQTLQNVTAQEQLQAALDRVKDAQDAVKAARQRLTDVERSGAAAVQSALDRVAQAERAVADAQKDALRAQEDLNRARKEAAQDIQDLNNSLKDSQLDLREANLDLTDAEKNLQKVQNDPKASAEDKERAEIAAERARQRVEELTIQIQRLQEEQTKADKDGVEGSDKVVSAKERLEAANQRIIDQQANLAQAQAAVSQAEQDAAKSRLDALKAIEAAEKRVNDAKRAVEQQKRQMEIAKLQQKIAKERAKDQAKAAAAAARNAAAGGPKGGDKFAKLSPAAQAAAKAIKAFQAEYLKWQEKLEPAVLPVITGALKIMQKLFTPLTPLIKGSAGALVALEQAASKALGGKFWKDFFKELSAEAPGAITGLAKSLGNVITGIVGVIRAFLPFSKDVVGGIESATSKFATFGKTLGASEGFKSFISYAKENGPKVIEVVRNIFTAIKNLITGLSGTGSGALDVIVGISSYLASLSPETLKTLTLAILGVVAAFKTWKIITSVVDGVKKAIQTASSIVDGAKSVWSGLSKAATGSAKLVKRAASGVASAVKGIGKGAGKAGSAVWTGIRTAATTAANVAKASATRIAAAARAAGATTAKGASLAWDGIRTAASKAGGAAKSAATAIVGAGRTAATAAVGLGKVAFQYAAIGLQAAAAAAKQVIAAVAQRAVAAATVIWSAAQRVLNLVLSANPIGLVIAAIGLLVAAVIFLWNKFPPFRQAVEAAWQGIQTAIQWAWTNVIQPVLQAIWSFITDTLAPIFAWLWNNIIVPAWQGISAVISAAWTNVIQPALKAIWAFITNNLAPKVLWLWNNVIVPAWKGISAAVKLAWDTVIKPVLSALWAYITNTLAPKVLWLFENVVKPAFTKIGDAISFAWNKVIKPVFQFLVDFITKTIPDGFSKGVDLIGKAWNLVKDVAKKPVQFIVDVVYNNGIVKVWNAVADILGLKDLKLKPLAFAAGGIYPGYTPGKDIGMAAVSGGEAIMRPEWTRAVGEDYVHGANSAARSGGVGGVARFLGVAGDPGFAGAFADGGIIGGIKNLVAGGLKLGAEKLLNPLLDKAGQAMGGSPWGKMLVNAPKQMIANVIKWIAGKDKAGGGPALAYAKAQLGKPYQWGATGPAAFDCSGLTMRAWQAAGVDDIPRISQDQMAWVHPVGKPQPGDLGFPHPGHVWMYSNPVSKIVEAPYTGAKVREVAARGAQLMGRPPSLFDSGGQLMPGTSLVHNGTGRPEPVLTDRQWKAIASAPAKGGDGAKSLVNIEGDFIAESGQSPYAIAQEFRYQMGSQLGLH